MMRLEVDLAWAPRDAPLPEGMVWAAFLDEPDRYFAGDEGAVFYPFGWPRGRPYLVCIRSTRHGFSFSWSRGDGFSPPRQRYMTSVHTAATMAVGVDHPTAEVRPLGSFVSAEVALRVVLDFDRDPLVLSGAVSWMPYDDVPATARPTI